MTVEATFDASVLDARVRGIAKSATLAIQAESARRIAAGERVFKLGLGQSPFPVPAAVVDALRAHAAEKDYLPVEGLPALRDAVAGYHRRRNDAICSGADVLVGPGSKELMFLLQFVFDGEILIPTPAWVSYGPQAHLVGRKVVPLVTERSRGYAIDLARLGAYCKEGGRRPRLLVLNSPSNPTGLGYDTAALTDLARVLREHEVVVLSDEIYGELHYQGRHASMARAYPEGTILSSGLSKWCGAGGWRLGTFTFAPRLRPLLEAMAAVASETFTTTSAPIQYAAVRAFQGGAALERYLGWSRSVLSTLTGRAAELLRGAGAHVFSPTAGFYVFADFEALRAPLAARGIETSAQLAERLMRETGVACLPGSCFMREDRELSLRLSLVDFDGARALSRAASTDSLGHVDHAAILDACRPTTEAVERIADFVRAG